MRAGVVIRPNTVSSATCIYTHLFHDICDDIFGELREAMRQLPIQVHRATVSHCAKYPSQSSIICQQEKQCHAKHPSKPSII